MYEYIYLLYLISLVGWTIAHFALSNTLLLGTVCFKVPWYTLHPNSLSSSTHFAPQNTLLLSTRCNSAHFAHQNTLIPGTLYFLEHFTPWNTLLPRTLCFKWSRVRSMLQRKSHHGAINVFQGSMCSKELSVLENRDKKLLQAEQIFFFSQNGQVSKYSSFWVHLCK